MPNKCATPVPSRNKDFRLKTKFIATVGTQLILGVLGIAVSAAVTIYVAKAITVPLQERIHSLV